MTVEVPIYQLYMQLLIFNVASIVNCLRSDFTIYLSPIYSLPSLLFSLVCGDPRALYSNICHCLAAGLTLSIQGGVGCVGWMTCGVHLFCLSRWVKRSRPGGGGGGAWPLGGQNGGDQTVPETYDRLLRSEDISLPQWARLDKMHAPPPLSSHVVCTSQCPAMIQY